MELVRLDYGPMCRNDSCMYGCKVAFLMYILIPFCRKCGWLCIFHEEFCEKDKFAYHIVDILRNLLFFMVYLLWTVFGQWSEGTLSCELITVVSPSQGSLHGCILTNLLFSMYYF